jgi:sporulation integral membrane protein YlbJ
MLIFPKQTFEGASNGLLLWFQIVLPTLLPFIILSNLLIHTNAVTYISTIVKPFMQRLFRVSDYGCYAVFVGFLCGYPMGAKVVADLIQTEKISGEEGQYLLSFCNNTSPMFIISFIVMQNFKNESLLLGTLVILYLAPVVCSFLFRRFYKVNKQSFIQKKHSNEGFFFDFNLFDNCIMNGFETITKVGGYIMLFSVLFSICETVSYTKYLLPFLEITNGIHWISNNIQPLYITFPLVLTLTSFGGFCAIAQTNSMIQESKLSILPYIIQKLITALVTSLLAMIYIQFIHQ